RVSSLTFSGLLSARDTVIGETPASRATSSTRTVPALRLRPPAVIGRPRTRACLSPGKPEAPAGQALALLDADDFVPLGGAFRTRHRADLDLLRAEPDREMAEAHVLALARAARLNGESEDVSLSHLADRKSTRLNSSHVKISYAVFCLKKKT